MYREFLRYLVVVSGAKKRLLLTGIVLFSLFVVVVNLVFIMAFVFIFIRSPDTAIAQIDKLALPFIGLIVFGAILFYFFPGRLEEER